MSDILYIDIETVSNPDMLPYLPEIEPVRMEDAPRNYKKAEAIAGWVKREEEKRSRDRVKEIERMALDVDYAKVVAIGFAFDDHPLDVYSCEGDYIGGREDVLLRCFWSDVANSRRLCGWNILGFDLPIILRRSWALGVQPTRMLDFRRYSTSTVIDLMQILYNWGQAPGPRYRGLKDVCAMYGITNEYPELDGSKVAEMDEETLIAYCANDVRMTRELAQKTRGYYWK